ncbi:cyclic nucleotide-binding domain-containing protein [Rhodobacteraceae bacterium NNCM2]|nr:cyclic nucleotide-binding domain-containing protein [Coraliihabitans acroporae]
MISAFFETFHFTGWAILVHLAALTQFVGYLIRDQLLLRIMLLIGTLLYISYYRLFPEVPLWDAILWGSALALANLLMIVQIIRDRTRFRMSSDEERLYQAFNHIGPGDFRRLMKIASFRKAEADTFLTFEGQRPEELFYVIDGNIQLSKQGKEFHCPPQTFIGELSLVTRGSASATVALEPGSRYVAWNRERLEHLTRRNPALKLALDLLLSHDMAAKIQRA